MRLAVLTLSLCVAGPASAGVIDWTKDPVVELQRLQAGGDVVLVNAPDPHAAVVAVQDEELALKDADVVAAEAAGMAEIDRSARSLSRPDLYLTLNNTGEKVGGVFAACEENRGDGIPDCERALLVFPQLRYDPENKRILLGEEIVATNHWYLGIRMASSFRLACQVLDLEDKRGFNVVKRRLIKLYLVRTGK